MDRSPLPQPAGPLRQQAGTLLIEGMREISARASAKEPARRSMNQLSIYGEVASFRWRGFSILVAIWRAASCRLAERL